MIEPPSSAAHARKAASLMGRVLVDVPSQRSGVVVADAVLVMAAEGAAADEIREAIVPFELIEMRLAYPGLRALLNGLIDRGHDSARDVLELLVGVDHRGAAELAHSAALRLEDHALALRVVEDAATCRWMTPAVSAALAAQRALACADSDTALEILEAAPTERSASFSNQYLRAAATAGVHERILAYLDEVVHNLSTTAEAQHRFEAHWALGDSAAALASLDDARHEQPLDALLLRLTNRALQLEFDDANDRMLAHIRSLEAAVEEPTMGDVTSLMAAYFDLESLPDVLRLGGSTPDELFGPASRIHLARTKYVLRDFAGALATLEPLHGSWWRWDGDKLKARILLEMGDPASALDMRSRRRPSGELDEVEFHALLSLHREDEAFRRYLPVDDGRHLARVFPRTAHLSGPLEQVSHRTIVMQAGPGDEVMLSALYREIARHSERVSATCEPRLRALMEQSFPDIEFLPVQRLRPNEFGWKCSEPGRVEAGPMRSLLDERALQVARSSDSVVLGRSLPAAVRSAGLPSTGYLMPSAQAMEVARSRRGSRPLVGVVWRSEMRSPVRDIHYLTVADLAHLLPADVDVACLQHDVEDDELAALRGIVRGELIDLADLDLRNDFDTAAAVVSTCDVVVGIGTTIVELAGAVGTATVMMQPTHFGTWRARPDTDTDYWHRSVVVAKVERPWDTGALIAKARRQLDTRLAEQRHAEVGTIRR
ncbi:MAG: hypothetical protein AAFZ07_11425 [Actinomycetota bacterium]